MTLTVLVDNDVVIKLSRMDAFSEGMASIGGKPGAVGSLRVMLRYMGIADDSKRLQLTASQEEADRLGAALHTIVELELTKSEADLAAVTMKLILEKGLDIQEGELALMVTAVSRGKLDVATGDKRALAELPGLQQCWPQLNVLRDRFICFEQIFELLCKAKGLKRIQAAVQKSPDADGTIRFVLGETATGGQSNFVKGLEFVRREQIERAAPGWLKAF